jgi:hypothetical protein
LIVLEHCTDWPASFESGLDFKYSDINVDGIVDTNDIVELNRPFTATRVLHQDSLGVRIYLSSNNLSPNVGDTIEVSAIFGTINYPIDSIYSVAMDIRLGPQIFYKVISTELNNGILGDTISNLYYFCRPDPFYSYKGVLASRTDHQNTTLAGDTLFRFKIFIMSSSNTGNYFLSSFAHIVTKGGFTIPVHIISDTLNIIENIPDLNSNSFISIFPNPSNDKIMIVCNANVNGKLSIRNAAGQLVVEKKEYRENMVIDIESLSEGVYFIFLETNFGTIRSKFIKF